MASRRDDESKRRIDRLGEIAAFLGVELPAQPLRSTICAYIEPGKFKAFEDFFPLSAETYDPDDARTVAVEPSHIVIAQRLHGAAPRNPWHCRTHVPH